MRNGFRGIRVSAAVTALVACAAAVILGNATGADTKSHAVAMPDFRCYCECESNGKMCAMKFCELPKYENRDWAMSCHKHAAADANAGKPEANPAPAGKRSTEKRARGVLSARRESDSPTKN